MATILVSSAAGAVPGLDRVAISPFLTGPLLLSATCFPDTLRNAFVTLAETLPEKLATSLLRSIPLSLSSRTAITALGVVFALGAHHPRDPITEHHSVHRVER